MAQNPVRLVPPFSSSRKLLFTSVFLLNSTKYQIVRSAELPLFYPLVHNSSVNGVSGALPTWPLAHRNEKNSQSGNCFKGAIREFADQFFDIDKRSREPGVNFHC
jgi:hypothetical protein